MHFNNKKRLCVQVSKFFTKNRVLFFAENWNFKEEYRKYGEAYYRYGMSIARYTCPLNSRVFFYALPFCRGFGDTTMNMFFFQLPKKRMNYLVTNDIVRNTKDFDSS